MNKYVQSRSIHTVRPLQRAAPSPWQHSQPLPLASLLPRGQPKFIAISTHHENEGKLSVSYLLGFLLLLRLELRLLLLLLLSFCLLRKSAGAAARFLASCASFTHCLIRGSRLEICMQVVSAKPNVNETKHYLTRESYRRNHSAWRYLPFFCELAQIYSSSRYIVYHRSCNRKNWNQTHQGRYCKTQAYRYLHYPFIQPPETFPTVQVVPEIIRSFHHLLDESTWPKPGTGWALENCE